MSLRSSLHQLEGQVTGAPRPDLLRIGAVAARTGFSVKTIRFYCDQGLLRPSSRSEAGYRLFEASVFSELALIRTLRSLDIPLSTTAAYLQARRSGLCTCEQLQSTLRLKAGDIAQRVADLQSLEREIHNMLSHWQRCGGDPAGGIDAKGFSQ